MLCFGTRMVFSWIVPVVPQGFLFRLLCFCVCPFVAFGFVWVAFACVWLCLWGVRVFLCDLFGDLGLVLDPLSEALPPCGTRMLFLDSLWEGLSMPFGSRQAFLRLCGGCLCEVFVLRRSHAYYPWGGRINLSVNDFAVGHILCGVPCGVLMVGNMWYILYVLLCNLIFLHSVAIWAQV